MFVKQKKKKVYAFCTDAKGTEGKNYIYQYLERLKHGQIYRTFVKSTTSSWTDPISISFKVSSPTPPPPFFFSSEPLPKHLLFSKPLLFKDLSYICGVFSPQVLISDLLRILWLLIFSSFSCYLPPDCIFRRAQGRYLGTEETQ